LDGAADFPRASWGSVALSGTLWKGVQNLEWKQGEQYALSYRLNQWTPMPFPQESQWVGSFGRSLWAPLNRAADFPRRSRASVASDFAPMMPALA